MNNNEITYSNKRTVKYLKKYWYIILIVTLAGMLGAIIVHVQAHGNSGETYTCTTTVLVTNEQTKVTNNAGTTINNIIAYVSTDDFNNKLREKAISHKIATSDVSIPTVLKVNDSDFFTISTSASKYSNSSLLNNLAIDIVKNTFVSRNDGIKLELLSSKNTKDEDTTNNLFNLFLIVFVSFIIGIAIVLIKMIFSNKIVTSKEVHDLLNINELLTSDRIDVEKSIEKLVHIDNISLVILSSNELIEEKGDTGLQYSTINNILDNESIDKHNLRAVTVIKEWDCCQEDLLQLKKIINLFEIDIKGYFFIN